MGKIQPKTYRSLAIVLGVVTLVACGFYLSYDSKIQLLQKQLNNAESALNETQQIYDANQQQLDTLNAKIEEYTNIDKLLVDIKDEYFANALQVDALARSGQANFKVAYLTFDDGPYLLTEDFMKVLDQYEVQATFFIRKRSYSTYAHIYPYYMNGCHTVGNHTATHDIFGSLYDSEDSFMNDIKTNEENILNLFSIKTNIMRFPGGSAQPRYMGMSRNSIIARLDEAGYGYVDWDISCGDGGPDRAPEVYLNNVITRTPNYNVAVVLMHDYHPSTLAMLPTLIETLQQQGYIFLPLFYESPSVIKGN